jgi:hypothetical protein
MSIPFISNIALTEVDSSGNLNDKAGTTKSKFPIQIFKLTDNITGNLTLDNNTAHKKIIFDTNTKTVINDTGSPLTINSSVPVELKGTGNIQCTDLTFTSSVTDTSHTGTTTISEANNSTVVVSTFNRTADISESSGVGVATGFGGSFSTSDTVLLPNSEKITLPNNPGTNNGTLRADARLAGEQMLAVAGGDMNMTNLKDSNFRITFGNGVTKTGSDAIIPTDVHGNPVSNAVRFSASGGGQVTFSIIGTIGSDAFMRPTLDSGSVSSIKIPNNTISAGGRNIAFTNNLSINVVLTGDDPFDNVTVTASGGTQTEQVSTTDGSFSLTGTISGSNSSFTPARPYALKLVNNGSGNILIGTAYSGTLSTRAF